MTKAQLPSYFHVPLDIKKNPDPPHDFWMVPSKLFSASSPAAPSDPAVHGPTAYYQSRQSLFRWITNKDMWKRGIGHRNEERMRLEGRNVLQWRADMDGFLLELLRGVVIRALRWSLMHPNSKGVVRCKSVEQAKRLNGVACIIHVDTLTNQAILAVTAEVEAWSSRCDALVEELRKIETFVKRKKGKAGVRDFNVPWPALLSASQPRLNPKLAAPPLEYPTVSYRDRRVPLYSLVDVLGAEKTTELLKGTTYEDSSCFVVKESRLTVGAQMALMKLQGYLT
jgi:hypothetical protein